MKKNKLRIKHKDNTFAFISCSGNGAVIGFPQHLPDNHLTFIVEKIKEQLIFSFHKTDETKEGKDKHNQLIKLNLNLDDNLQALLRDQLNESINSKIKKYYSFHQIPGCAYYGGLFNLSLIEETKRTGNLNLYLESVLEKLIIVKKARHLKYYEEKIWIVLKKGRGKKGNISDIGILFGPGNNKDSGFSFAYLSYKDLLEILKLITKSINLDGIFDEYKDNFCLTKNLDYNIYNDLFKNGRRKRILNHKE